MKQHKKSVHFIALDRINKGQGFDKHFVVDNAPLTLLLLYYLFGAGNVKLVFLLLGYKRLHNSTEDNIAERGIKGGLIAYGEIKRIVPTWPFFSIEPPAICLLLRLW